MRACLLQNAPTQPFSPHLESETGMDQVNIRGWARFFRLLIGIFLLLPLSTISSYALLKVLYANGRHLNFEFFLTTPVWYTLLGGACFTIILLSRLAPSVLLYCYVAGHELTHAIAAKLCNGKIHTIKIDANGGYMETDKNNFFIGLAPYIFPLWLLIWVSVFSALLYFCPFAGCEQWLYGGLGFWWFFHIYWTLWIIPREQPDLLENGLFFSNLLILIVNTLGLGIILSLFGLVNYQSYLAAFLESAQQLLLLLNFVTESIWLWCSTLFS